MKTRTLLLLFLLVLVVHGIKAQSFEKGQKDLNIGLAAGGRYMGHGYSHSMPTVNASFDYGITDEISLGGYFGFSSATYEYQLLRNCGGGNFYYYHDKYDWRFYTLGIRGAYHFDKYLLIDHVDLYAGLFLGNAFGRYSYTTDDPCKPKGFYSNSEYGGLVFDGFIGCRYRFTDKVGIFCELGYYMGYANIGLNLKL